jgi:TatD DNase family protein
MILVDVHAHLDSVFFGEDIDEVMERAKEAGVVGVIANGVDMDTNREVLALSRKYDLIKPALGIYPIDKLEKETGKSPAWDVDEELLFIEKNIDKISAIGECGLDYSDTNEEEAEEQVEIFGKLVDIAEKYNKPIIVHSRKAEEEVIDILEKSGHKKIIMHCFSGNHKLVERIRKNKWLFSIPTSMVRSEHFQKLVKETSLSQVLTETDAPFLSPFKDKKNEPAYVIETIKKIAEIKKMMPEEVANQVYMNYRAIFE